MEQQHQPGSEAEDGQGSLPTEIGTLLAGVGLGDEEQADPIAAPDEVTQRLRMLTGGAADGRQPGEPAGDQPEDDAGLDPLAPFRETLDAADPQLPDDDAGFEEWLTKAMEKGQAPKPILDRVYGQRNKLRERYVVGQDGKGAYDDFLELAKQAGPDSRSAVQNLTAALYQQWSQQQQDQQPGGEYGMSQPQGGYPQTQTQPPVFTPQPQQDQAPAWAQEIIGTVKSLSAQQEQAARQQVRDGLLKSVETELRKWDLLDDGLAQEYIGMRMQADPSVPIPELVKQYAEKKRRGYEQATTRPAGGQVPPPGDLSPDIGRGSTGAVPPSKGAGIDLKSLTGEERIKAAEALIRSSQRR